MVWERCCTCREDAFEAAVGHASRIELCERLEVGGVTPSERNICLSMEAGLQVTFHRAFDECRDPYGALEDIIRLGCSRVLTSGHAATAPEGAAVIKELVSQVRDRIIVMPGSGVTPDNVRMLAEMTGASEFHGTKLY